MAAVTMTLDEARRTLDDVTIELQGERDRLAVEAQALRLAHQTGCTAATVALLGPIFGLLSDDVCKLAGVDPGELITRAAALETIAETLENAAAQLPRLSASADAATVVRALESAARILAAVQSVSAVGELAADLVQLAQDLRKSAQALVPRPPSFGDAALLAVLGAIGLALVAFARR